MTTSINVYFTLKYTKIHRYNYMCKYSTRNTKTIYVYIYMYIYIYTPYKNDLIWSYTPREDRADTQKKAPSEKQEREDLYVILNNFEILLSIGVV
jgi:hypothetical protein